MLLKYFFLIITFIPSISKKDIIFGKLSCDLEIKIVINGQHKYEKIISDKFNPKYTYPNFKYDKTEDNYYKIYLKSQYEEYSIQLYYYTTSAFTDCWSFCNE